MKKYTFIIICHFRQSTFWKIIPSSWMEPELMTGHGGKDESRRTDIGGKMQRVLQGWLWMEEKTAQSWHRWRRYTVSHRTEWKWESAKGFCSPQVHKPEKTVLRMGLPGSFWSPAVLIESHRKLRRNSFLLSVRFNDPKDIADGPEERTLKLFLKPGELFESEILKGWAT